MPYESLRYGANAVEARSLKKKCNKKGGYHSSMCRSVQIASDSAIFSTDNIPLFVRGGTD